MLSISLDQVLRKKKRRETLKSEPTCPSFLPPFLYGRRFDGGRAWAVRGDYGYAADARGRGGRALHLAASARGR